MKNGQNDLSRPIPRRPVQCPKCSSYSHGVVEIVPPYIRCRCADCGPIHDYQPRRVADDDGSRLPEEDDEDEDFRSTNDTTNGEHAAQTKAAPNGGFLTSVVEQAIAAGPAGIRQAQRVALKYAQKFQAETEDHFKKRTKFLSLWFDSNDPNARACARYALVWRPKFLSGLSLTNSPTLAAGFARTTKQTAYNHRKWDREFAEQWDEAVEHAVDLLHSRAWQRALEGDCEPVFCMGTRVGYVRKYDSRLQIGMLRAHRPDTFKTAGVRVNLGVKGNILVLTEEERMELQRVNRDWLLNSPIEGQDCHSGTKQAEALTTNEQPNNGVRLQDGRRCL